MEKLIGKASNPMEKEIEEYIKPFITPEIERYITEKKLTLKGCLEHCFKKGKAFEVKMGNRGYAPITQEQHFKWVSEYFGIKGGVPSVPVSATAAAESEEKHFNAVELDFDDLF